MSLTLDEQLADAMLAAFPTREALAQCLRFKLGVRLNEIAGSGNLKDTVFSVVEWASAEERVRELVDALLACNGRNLKLRAVSEALAEPGAAGADVGGGPPGSVAAPAPRAGIDVVLSWGQRVVPTAIWNHLQEGPVAVARCLVANRTGAPIRVRLNVQIEGYSAEWAKTHDVPPAGECAFASLPLMLQERTQGLTDITPATLRARLDDAERKVILHEDTCRVALLPQTTLPLELRGEDGKLVDMLAYLPVFVTPNDPAVQRLLPVIRRRAPDGELAGYLGDPDAQARAVFDTMKALGFAYVNTLKATAPAGAGTVQRVRPAWESLMIRSGNCVDGSILLASLLEAISLNAALAVVPGHALVAWETGPGSGRWRYLETTEIARCGFADACDAAAKLIEDVERQQREAGPGGPPLLRFWSIAAARAAGYHPVGRIVHPATLPSFDPADGIDAWPPEVRKAFDALSDPDARRRSTALDDLSAMRHREALVLALENQRSGIRGRAAAVLAGLKDPQAGPVLLEALDDPAVAHGFDPMAALEELGADAVPHLINLLDRPDRRVPAIDALGRIGSAEAIDHLARCLEDADTAVRAAACRALEKIGTTRARNVLRKKAPGPIDRIGDAP